MSVKSVSSRWHIRVIQWLNCVLLFAVSVAAVQAANPPPPATAFEAANRLYEEAKYGEAAAAYRQLIQSNQISSAVLFNLGNASFKAGHLGEAITSYRRAEQLAPRDPDIQTNLQFARTQVKGAKLSPPVGHRWLGRLTLDEWTLLASVSLWLLFLILSLLWWQPALKPTLKKAVAPVALLAVALCGCLGFAFQDARSTRMAVVLVPEISIRFGPLEESPTAFTAHDGAELRVLDEKDQWLRVGDGSGNNGWLPRDKVALIGG